MTTLTKRLNKLLDYGSLYKEFNNLTVPKVLIPALIEAVDTNYRFTTIQIHKFIEQAIQDNIGNDNIFLKSNDIEHIKIIKYIFTNYHIDNEQLDCICYFGNLSCIGYLFERQYNFPDSCYLTLLQYGYKFFKIEYCKTVNKNVIFFAYLSIIYDNYIIFDKCIDLIRLEAEHFDSEYVKLIFDMRRVESENLKNNEFKILLNSICFKCTIDDIYNLLFDKKIIMNQNNELLFDYIFNKFGNDKKLVSCILQYDDDDECFLKILSNGYKLTIEDLNLRLQKKEILLTNNYKKHKFLKLNDCCSSTSIGSHKRWQYWLITLFKIFKLQPNINTLNIACEKGYTSSVKQLIKEHNLIPQKETLDKSIISEDIELITIILNHKLTPDDVTFYMMDKKYYKQEIIELLISYGLVIKFEHIEYLLFRGTHLKDLDRFGIKYDEKLYFTCFVNSHFPDEYIKIEENRLKLYKLCCDKKLKYQKLLEFLKKNNIGFDKYAFHNIIINNYNLGTEIMKKHNFAPSLLTTFRAIGAPNKMVLDIIKKYDINELNMMETYIF